jgi:hypothetical protein
MSRFFYFFCFLSGLVMACAELNANSCEKYRYCCRSRVQATAHRRDVAREIAAKRYDWYISSHYQRKNTLRSPQTFFKEQKRDYVQSIPYRRRGSRDRIRVPRDYELRFLPVRYNSQY